MNTLNELLQSTPRNGNGCASRQETEPTRERPYSVHDQHRLRLQSGRRLRERVTCGKKPDRTERWCGKRAQQSRDDDRGASRTSHGFSTTMSARSAGHSQVAWCRTQSTIERCRISHRHQRRPVLPVLQNYERFAGASESTHSLAPRTPAERRQLSNRPTYFDVSIRFRSSPSQ